VQRAPRQDRRGLGPAYKADMKGDTTMLSLGGILLGIINVAIVVAILVLIGLVIVWFMSYLGFPIPEKIQQVFMVIVALIALAMLVALLLGAPLPFHVVGTR
jgi:hypothetical protein